MNSFEAELARELRQSVVTDGVEVADRVARMVQQQRRRRRGLRLVAGALAAMIAASVIAYTVRAVQLSPSGSPIHGPGGELLWLPILILGLIVTLGAWSMVAAVLSATD